MAAQGREGPLDVGPLDVELLDVGPLDVELLDVELLDVGPLDEQPRAGELPDVELLDEQPRAGEPPAGEPPDVGPLRVGPLRVVQPDEEPRRQHHRRLHPLGTLVAWVTAKPPLLSCAQPWRRPWTRSARVCWAATRVGLAWAAPLACGGRPSGWQLEHG